MRAWLESGKRPPTSAISSPSPQKKTATDTVCEEQRLEKAEELVAMEMFKDQRLIAKDGRVYCVACKTYVESEPRLLRQHCFQKQPVSSRAEFEGKSLEEKMRLRHYKKMIMCDKQEKEGEVLLKAIQLNRKKILEGAVGAVQVRKKLEDEEIARRVLVFETLAGAGIPLAKLDDPDFLSLVEGNGPRLGGRTGVLEVQPFVQERLQEQLCQALDGVAIGLFCDGSKSNFAIEASIARFISLLGKIQHLCIGMSRIDRSLDGLQLKGLVQRHLEVSKIAKTQVFACTMDSAAVNKAMGKQFNWEVRSFPAETRFSSSFPIHHCFSHMISNAGKKWRESMPASVQVLSGLKGLRKSDSAKALFREMMGIVLPQGTENRWFYWVDFVSAVLPHWSSLPGFVRRCTSAGFMPKKVARMELVVSNRTREILKAGLEVLFMKLLGQPLAQAAYFLEGDSFLAPYAYSVMFQLNDLLLHIARTNSTEQHEYLAAMQVFSNGNGGNLHQSARDEVIREVWRTRTSLAEYWRESIWNGMRHDLDLFQGFSVLDPLQLQTMDNPEVVRRLNFLFEGEEHVGGNNPFRRFKGLKGFNENVMIALVAQLSDYRQRAGAFAPLLVAEPRSKQPTKLWEWWWNIRNDESIKQWILLAHLAVLQQPSSAVIERFFSVYKGMTSTQQCAEDEETSLLRAQARYNKGKME